MEKEFLMRWYLLLAAIGANITSNYLLKRAAAGSYSSLHDLLNPFLVFGIGFAALTLISYTFALREFPLSVAYSVVTTLAYVGVFLVSWLALGEHIPPLRLLGASLVLVGVICMALSVDSNSPMQAP